MPIALPPSPSPGDEYVYNGVVYVWDGTKWTGRVPIGGDPVRQGLSATASGGPTTLYNYVGYADVGLPTSHASWTITRITIDTTTAEVTGTGTATGSWDDRTIHTYT